MIVILGASCSGKDTIFDRLKEHSRWREMCKKEFTTRPSRHPIRAEEDDSYNFISKEKYFELLNSGKMASNFKVDVHNDTWYYGIHKDDIGKGIITTNPASFTQLCNNCEDIRSIYIDVSQRERLIRMLRRGDNVSESYRRSVHDDGHFSGIRERVDYIVDGEKSKDEVFEEVVKILCSIKGY